MSVVLPFPVLPPPPPVTVFLRPSFSITATGVGLDVRVIAVPGVPRPTVRARA